MDLDTFTQAYVECLTWLQSETEFYNISRDDMNKIESDCAHFIKRAAKYLKGLDAAQCGHDFYLTRNGHGSGFWDRGYDEKISVMLCKISKDLGECYIGMGE